MRKQDRVKLRQAVAETPAAEKPAAKDAEASGLGDTVLRVLGTVAAGIGIVGLVTVVGAGIFWVRFDAIGLPATQAVSVMPETELLAQGIQEVTIFLLIGLGAVLVIALVDPKGLITRGTVGMLVALVLGAWTYAIVFTGIDFWWTVLLAAVTVFLAVASVGIAYATGLRLLPLLVSVFIASLIFSAGCALLTVHDQKFAQGIAIRFGAGGEQGKGVTGIYVAVTDKTIYFGRNGENPDLDGIVTTGLYEVPLDETTTYAVGPLLATETGEGVERTTKESARQLLTRLFEDGKRFVAPASPPAPAKDAGAGETTPGDKAKAP